MSITPVATAATAAVAADAAVSDGADAVDADSARLLVIGADVNDIQCAEVIWPGDHS